MMQVGHYGTSPILLFILGFTSVRNKIPLQNKRRSQRPSMA